MAYHVPPAIPRHRTRPWWIWLLWLGGLSSCLFGLYRRDGFRTPLSGPFHILGDSVIASELGIMLLLILLVVMGVLAWTTRFWCRAWGGMLILTIMLMPLCLVVATHTERMIRRFGPTIPAPWAADAACISWLLVGGTGLILLTCFVALGTRTSPPLPPSR